jgi:hypothetical protein
MHVSSMLQRGLRVKVVVNWLLAASQVGRLDGCKVRARMEGTLSPRVSWPIRNKKTTYLDLGTLVGRHLPLYGVL